MDQTELRSTRDDAAGDEDPLAPAPGADRAGREGVVSTLDRTLRGRLEAALERWPRLEPPLRRLRDHYTRAWIAWTRINHNVRHSAPIDPYRIARVDPHRIEYVARKERRSRFKRLGSVVGGDWDQRVRRFSETVLYRGFQSHFEDGRRWEETAFYRTVLEQIENGQTRWDCDTRAELDERCRRLDEFYRTVERDGFRTQRELASADVAEPIRRDRVSVHDRIVNDEVGVDVGRRGGLLFADGRNRLAVAKLLDVDALPVVFLRRHPKWVAFRDAVADHVAATGVLPDAVADHPDLRQLVDH